MKIKELTFLICIPMIISDTAGAKPKQDMSINVRMANKTESYCVRDTIRRFPNGGIETCEVANNGGHASTVEVYSPVKKYASTVISCYAEGEWVRALPR